MALETGTYISDLVATNPTASDPVAQGDDHLRLLKSTIKATFPNVNGAVSATDEQLSFVTGVTSAIQTQLDRATLTSGTAVASTSGTTVDFTSIPSWAKRITVMLNGVSLSGTDFLLLQIGDSGGVETAGYATSSASIQNAAATTVTERTDGWGLQNNSATGLFTGSVVLTLLNASTNTWVASGNVARGNGGVNVFIVTGSKSLSATLDRVRLTVSGTDTFDAGSINILYD